MNRTLGKIFLLMLIISIGITIVNASPQVVTIDVNPDNAGTVQLWKVVNYGTNKVGYDFVGSTKTIANYNLDTKDSTNVINGNTVIAIIPLDDSTSQYIFIKQCDHEECLSGTYVGELYQTLTTYKATAYYEIPTDKEKPIIMGITTDPRNPYTMDYINVYVSAKDNVAVTYVSANNVELKLGTSYWSGKILALSGTNRIGIMVCDAAKNCAVDTSVEYTSIPKPTSTPTPTPTTVIPFHISTLTITDLNNNIILIDVKTTGDGTLGIDMDEARILTKDITIAEGGFKTQFETTLGVHFICVYDIKNSQKEIKCDSVEIKPPATPTPTSTQMSTSTSTATGNYGAQLDYGILSIDTEPKNASIYINEVHSGFTPKVFDSIKAGGYSVKITKTGYKDYTEKIIIGKSAMVEIAVKLISINETSNYTSNSTDTTNNENKETLETNEESTSKTDTDEKESTSKTDADKKDELIGNIIVGIFILLLIVISLISIKWFIDNKQYLIEIAKEYLEKISKK